MRRTTGVTAAQIADAEITKIASVQSVNVCVAGSSEKAH
jgi:hypothetical protein